MCLTTQFSIGYRRADVTRGILFLYVHIVPIRMLMHIHVYHVSEGDSCLAGSRKTSREFFCLLILRQAG